MRKITSCAAVLILSSSLTAVAAEPSGRPRKESTTHRHSNVSGTASTSQNKRNSQTKTTWAPAGGFGMGSLDPGYFAPVLESIWSDQRIQKSKAIGIKAQTYKLKVPAANGVITETDLRVGAALTHQQVTTFLPQMGEGNPETCEVDQVYETDALQADGHLAVLKGYKVGNHVFAYVLGGGESNGTFEKRKKGPDGFFVMEESLSPMERWVYLGAVAEGGVGIKGAKTTSMIGPTFQAGAKQNLNRDHTGHLEKLTGLTTGHAIGLKGRVVNEKLNAQASGSFGKSKATGKAGGGMGTLERDLTVDGEHFKFGCEVLVRVKSRLAVGVTAAGQISNSKIEDAQGGDLPMVTNIRSKDASVGVKAIWVIPSGSKTTTSGGVR